MNDSKEEILEYAVITRKDNPVNSVEELKGDNIYYDKTDKEREIQIIEEEVLKNMLNHYDDSPLLVGKISSDDIIKEAKMVSYKVLKEQINFKL